MDGHALLKLSDVLSAMWLVGGLLGRAVALIAARRAMQSLLFRPGANVVMTTS